MISRKFVQKINALLNRIEFFYTYSWINGLCFGYFQFSLSARKKAGKKHSPNFTVTPCKWGLIQSCFPNYNPLPHIVLRIKPFTIRIGGAGSKVFGRGQTKFTILGCILGTVFITTQYSYKSV